MLCINAKKKTPILESFLDGGGGENRTRVFPVQQYVTTSLVQHRFSMFRNIWFLAEQPTNLSRLGFNEPAGVLEHSLGGITPHRLLFKGSVSADP